MNRLDLKTRAKEQISGNVWILFACSLIALLISTAAYIVFAKVLKIEALGSVATILLSAPFSISIIMIYLRLADGIRPEISNTFDGFSIFGKSVLLVVLIEIFVTLWSLLFIVPGIIKAYSYSLAPYILAENPEMSANDAIKESKRLMNGHKMDFFVLQLSFIPWILLVCVTFGVASIYVSPYISATYVNFYNSIKEQPLNA